MDKIILALIAILVVLFVITLSARNRVKKLYTKFLTVGNSANLNGLQLANIAVEKLNLPTLSISLTSKNFTDAYNGKNKTLILSNAVCNYTSLTSLGVVAHEIGHAQQDKQNNRLFGLVTILNRFLWLTNKLILPLFLIGIPMFYLSHFSVIPTNFLAIGQTLTYIAFTFFIFNFIVKLTTIPLEYDASKKALKFLKDYKIVTKQEIKSIKKLLSAAAQTYISSMFDGIISISNKFKNLVSKK